MAKKKKNGTIEQPVSDEWAVVLESPIEWGGETVDRVDFREPTGKDLEALDLGKGEVSKTFNFASSLAGIPVGFFRRLTARDAFRCIQKVNGFLSDAPITGET